MTGVVVVVVLLILFLLPLVMVILAPNEAHNTRSFDAEMGWCTDVNCMVTAPHAPHGRRR